MSSKIEILVTENKSISKLNPANNAVRVFVDHDLDYGYWISEHSLFEMLDESQKGEYLKGSDAKIDVDVETARKIIEEGATPFKKRRI